MRCFCNDKASHNCATTMSAFLISHLKWLTKNIFIFEQPNPKGREFYVDNSVAPFSAGV